MGKRIIQQARGHGSLTYRVRKKAYRYKISYPPMIIEGKGKVLELIDSPGHTAPLAKISIGNTTFYNPAFKNIVEGQEIEIGKAKKEGDIAQLKDIPIGTLVFNLECKPGDGGKFVRTGGSSAIITKKFNEQVAVLLPSKKEVWFDERCRATLGVIAGSGRKDKPFVKAGNKWHAMKSRNKLWPRTSAVKMNVVDHPFGSGRGKRIKNKIAKRNVPPGKLVGLLWPRRTGRKKK
ncbi:MAG: 50S ribosomal protein L2 [Candidatus Pacearchaeota archaeon]